MEKYKLYLDEAHQILISVKKSCNMYHQECAKKEKEVHNTERVQLQYDKKFRDSFLRKIKDTNSKTYEIAKKYQKMFINAKKDAEHASSELNRLYHEGIIFLATAKKTKNIALKIISLVNEIEKVSIIIDNVVIKLANYKMSELEIELKERRNYINFLDFELNRVYSILHVSQIRSTYL